MKIDMGLLAAIFTPMTTILAVYISKWIEEKPKLLTYYGQISVLKLTSVNATVHTHSIIIRNTGKKPAVNVRIGHYTLPDFNIYPPCKFGVEELSSNAKEILIPLLMPLEQITITYSYPANITYDKINSYVKSDSGFANVINVISMPQSPKWLTNLIIVMGLIGLSVSAFFLTRFIEWLIKAVRVINSLQTL